MSTKSENNQVFRVVINDNDEIDVSYDDENSQDGAANKDESMIEMVLVDEHDENEQFGSEAEEEEEEVVEHVCKKCDKTFLDLNDLKRHLPFCRQNSAAHILKQQMYARIKEIEKECQQMEDDDKICYCCEENYDSCHAGHIRCPECPKSFKNSTSFQRHVFLLHSDMEQYPCEICNARCPSEQILKIHTGHHHKRGKPFACKKCGKEFTRRYHVLRHVKYSGCDAGHAKKEFECNVCSKVFFRVDNLRSHLRTHLGEDTKTRDYQCPYCEKSFYGTSTLNIHIRTHTGERPFACDLCEKVFPSNAALRKHRRYHTGEKPYECSICSRSFTAKEVLNRHVKTHTGERPHTCTICGKSFIQATQLRNHAKTHNGEAGSAFECPLCDQKFNRKSKLSKHLVVDHSSTDVEFKCKQCEDKFVSSAGLKRHITRKHTPKTLVCPICDEEFTDQGSFNFHRLTHTEDEPENLPVITLNQCTICYENFSTSLRLKRHINRNHKDVEKTDNEKRILNGVSLQTNNKSSDKLTKTTSNGEIIEEYVIEEIQQLNDEDDDNDDEDPKRLVIYEENSINEIKKPKVKSSKQKAEKESDSDTEITEYESQNEKNVRKNMKTRSQKVKYIVDDDDDDEEEEDQEEGEVLMVLETDDVKMEIDDKFESDIVEDEKFSEKIRKLLDFLVDTKTLKKFGWPRASVEDVLRRVILNCGHKFTEIDDSNEYITRMRQYVKLLFTVVVDNDSIKELLNNLTIDEVIDQVISMVDDD